MSKLRKKIEQIKTSREEMISSRWSSVNSTIEGYKTQVNAINEELKNTSYKPRREELLAARKAILNQANLFYEAEAAEQKKIYDGYKVNFNKLLSMDESHLQEVDLVNLDTSKHNVSFLKDIIKSCNREQIEEIFEDACYEGNAEKARLIKLYAGLKFKEEQKAKDKVNGDNRTDITNSLAEKRGDEESISVSRVKRLVDVASNGYSGISTGKWTSISNSNALVTSIWDEADPWANQSLEVEN